MSLTSLQEDIVGHHMKNLKSSYLPVDWPASRPKNVHAVTTLRNGGNSTGDYSEFNLAMHVGDDELSVRSNRKKLHDDLKLPAEPVWLEQVHSNKVLRLTTENAADTVPVADASVTSKPGIVCAVMTADCLPVFFCNQKGTEVGVAHAGWRGLHAGILSNTLDVMHSPSSEIHVHLGPAIGPLAFEVGREVYQAFLEINPENAPAFVENSKNHYLCDIYQLACIELKSQGVRNITGGGHCTFNENDCFYSFRQQQNTGRMANLIWMD